MNGARLCKTRLKRGKIDSTARRAPCRTGMLRRIGITEDSTWLCHFKVLLSSLSADAREGPVPSFELQNRIFVYVSFHDQLEALADNETLQHMMLPDCP